MKSLSFENKNKSATRGALLTFPENESCHMLPAVLIVGQNDFPVKVFRPEKCCIRQALQNAL